MKHGRRSFWDWLLRRKVAPIDSDAARVIGVVQIVPLRCALCREPLKDGDVVLKAPDAGTTHLTCWERARRMMAQRIEETK